MKMFGSAARDVAEDRRWHVAARRERSLRDTRREGNEPVTPDAVHQRIQELERVANLA
jgi:hypothetical protein